MVRGAEPGCDECTAARSHVGLGRETNEDAIAIAGGGRLLGCADGLGGLPRGEMASRIAVEHVVGVLSPALKSSTRPVRDWSRRLRRAVLGAHGAVRRAVLEGPDPTEMATTLIAAVTTRRRAYVCHVGDVRAYLLNRSGLRRLTDDHSLVFEAVRTGRISVEQARRHSKRNIVTQAVGLAEGVVPDVNVATVSPGDILLLCTDGLWETMAESELEVVLATGTTPASLAESILARALQAGAPDNVSFVVYRHP